MGALLSASALERVSLCPASAALPAITEPRADVHAARGTIIHAFLAAVPKVGRQAALDDIEDNALRDVCAALDLAHLPVDGAAYAAEVAFAYDVTTDTARELGRDIGRDYGDLRPGEIPGTADVVGLTADGERVIVFDYKTGWQELTPAHRNVQLGFLAVAAARAYGRRRAHVGLILVRDGEAPVFDRHEWGELELDIWADEIIGLVEHVDTLRADAEAGRRLPVTLGGHCGYCPARRACPGFVDMIQALARDPRGELIDLSAPRSLTDEDIGRAWRRIEVLKLVLETADKVVKDWIKVHGPVDLPDGARLVTVLEQREKLVGSIAREVIADLLGPEHADRAAEWKVTKESIEEACKKVAPERGSKVAPLKREVLAAIAARGGVIVSTYPQVKEIRR